MDLPQTIRLTAERLHEGHIAELCHMHGDAAVMATLGGVRSDSETERFLRENLAHWRRQGYGLFMFYERASGSFVGRGGLRRVEVAGREETELAYAVMAAFWGRGLASEMAAALLRHGGARLGPGGIVAFTLTSNAGSRRVMEKLGFRFERAIVHAGLPHALYRLRPAQAASN